MKRILCVGVIRSGNITIKTCNDKEIYSIKLNINDKLVDYINNEEVISIKGLLLLLC